MPSFPISPALRGATPKWWPRDSLIQVLAYGPFAVERHDGTVEVGKLLRLAPEPEGWLMFATNDRTRLLEPDGDGLRDGDALVVPTQDGPVTIRPLRESDRRAVLSVPDEVEDFAQYVREQWGLVS